MIRDNNISEGRKSQKIYIPVERLHLDKDNPRLSETIHRESEEEILKVLYREFDLDELAVSMSMNGYFEEEPLVVAPINIPPKIESLDLKKNPNNEKYIQFVNAKDTNFTVAEGNRRLSTVKILLDDDLRDRLKIKTWPKITSEVRINLSILPTIIYPTRNEILSYMGIRHIAGLKKWDAYAKARYIKEMEKQGHSIVEIEKLLGDKQAFVRKSYICHSMLEQSEEEFDYDTTKAKENFSFLFLSIGQGAIKRYLGLSEKSKEIPLDKPIKTNKMKELKNLLSWIYGEGKEKQSVIADSRDINNYLTNVVTNPEAVAYLEDTRNLREAYEMSDGEETMLRRNLTSASRSLKKALGVAHSYKRNDEIISEVKKCLETVKELFKAVSK